MAEPEDALVLRHLAEKFGAVRMHAGGGVVDVVDSEHDARCRPSLLGRFGAGRRGRVVVGQLQLSMDGNFHGADIVCRWFTTLPWLSVVVELPGMRG